MARIWQSGFELNSATIGVEWTTVTNGTIQTGTVRTGTYAGQITSLVSGSTRGFGYQFAAAAGNGPYFFRVYLNVGTRPSADNRIISLNNTPGLAGTSEVSIKLTNTGTLKLFNGTTQVGSDSAVLSLNTQYCVELKFDNTGGAAAGVAEARLEQAVFATASNLTIGAGILEIVLGGNLASEAQTAGNWFFDDAAINDSTGTQQTDYPGPGGITHLVPAAAGDNNGFLTQVGGTAGSANNFTRVDEITPDDATSYNGSATNGVIDDFDMSATPAAIGSGDTINVVAVGSRFTGSSSTGNANFTLRIKKVTGGNVTAGPSTTPTSTSWTTNTASNPKNYTLVTYTDPDGGAWTKATLDTSQAGYTVSKGNTNQDRISTLWVSIDSAPSTATSLPDYLSLLGVGM